uniref:Ig-like domain-containing protein n=1 Tax=Callorhinchus milii TaxID=7868 RepID=A0A4W3GJ61_CALMI
TSLTISLLISPVMALPSYVVSNGSSAVLLPCSPEAGTQFTDAVWDWYSPSRRNSQRVCVIRANTECDPPHHKGVSVADSNALQTGNVSLFLTPTLSQAGEYHCAVYNQQEMVYRSIVHLTVFNGELLHRPD